MRTNRKVSQVWLVVLLSFVMVVQILWKTYEVVGAIDADTLHIVSLQVEMSAR